MSILVLFGILALIQGGVTGDQGVDENQFWQYLQSDKVTKPPVSPAEELSSYHENSSGATEDNISKLNNAACRSFELRTSMEVFDRRLKTGLKPILLQRLEELSKMEQETYKVAIEVASSVYLLELSTSCNPTFETHGKKAGTGAMLLQEGARLVAQGQDLLRSAINDMSDCTE